MTTRLEIEHTVLDKGRIRIHRESLLELEDRQGVHETPFGRVGIGAKRNQLNTDILIDARNAPGLAERLKAGTRRISVGEDGNGAQQIGREVTLFVHSDLFRREKW